MIKILVESPHIPESGRCLSVKTGCGGEKQEDLVTFTSSQSRAVFLMGQVATSVFLGPGKLLLFENVIFK